MAVITGPSVAAPGGGRPLPRPKPADQVGHLRRLFVDPRPVLDELAREHGCVVGLGAGPLRVAIVGDPDALRELFATPNDSFRWGHKFNVLGFVVGPGSMIVSDGDDHRRRRSSVKAAFSRRRLNGWIPTIVEQTDRVVDSLVDDLRGAQRVVDLYPVGRTLVRDIVVRTLFGERMAGRSAEIGELFRRPQAYLESPGYKQFPHPLPRTTGRGARNCLGFALAQMELTLIISRLSQRLDVRSTGATFPEAQGMVVNRPRGGAPMAVSARESTP